MITNFVPGAYITHDQLHIRGGHQTNWLVDGELGKQFRERFSASITALNVANRRVELDNSVTFGGFHWNNPREIFVELRYRFQY